MNQRQSQHVDILHTFTATANMQEPIEQMGQENSCSGPVSRPRAQTSCPGLVLRPCALKTAGNPNADMRAPWRPPARMHYPSREWGSGCSVVEGSASQQAGAAERTTDDGRKTETVQMMAMAARTVATMVQQWGRRPRSGR